MSKLYEFLKSYIGENYSETIQSEEHLSNVARGLEYYLTETIFPDTIKDLSPNVNDQNDHTEHSVGLYESFLEQFLKNQYGQDSVMSLHFDSDDCHAEYYVAKFVSGHTEKPVKELKVCHGNDGFEKGAIYARPLNSEDWAEEGMISMAKPLLPLDQW
ncbi:hypothetical protein P9G84_10245 [Brevibacillus centrosporus]|uniref:hypothetical protein n=1 Tax=Brevibacillus centrosporus TaxID=54910 RepID=UPI00114279AD|nr:hypothetical protein [Brevibacillus centrosporus]MEC2129348.1 hypothetical protein [Brevibacillus centrosporus]GED33515.1 hypothetical protein BCE02nite_46560 [Brevibacillus centrosporus]